MERSSILLGKSTKNPMIPPLNEHQITMQPPCEGQQKHRQNSGNSPGGRLAAGMCQAETASIARPSSAWVKFMASLWMFLNWW